jgi:hypothetical protein
LSPAIPTPEIIETIIYRRDELPEAVRDESVDEVIAANGSTFTEAGRRFG